MQATNTNFVLLGQRKDLLKGYCAAHKPSKRSEKNQAWLSHGRNNVHDHADSFSSKEARAAAARHRPDTLDNSYHRSLPPHSGFCMVPASGSHWLPVQSLEWQGYNQMNIDHGLCPCAGAKEARKGAPGTVCFEIASGPRPLKVSHSLDTGESLRNE